MLLYFFLLTLVLFLLASLVSNYNARKYAAEVSRRVKNMETTYREFLNEKVDINDFRPGELRYDPELLAKEAVKKLTPFLDGLINYINKAYLSKVKISYQSEFFPNIISLCAEAFASKNKNKEKRLNTVNVERFRMALYDAIFADLFQRTLLKENDSKAQSD
jgi:hypothetical protein